MFPDGITFVCFYDAERVLSAIAKYLVHLLEEEEGRVNERGKMYREKGENMKEKENVKLGVIRIC